MLSIITYATAVINKVMKNIMMSKFFRKEQLINITKSLVLLLSFWEIQKERSLERNERESKVLVTISLYLWLKSNRFLTRHEFIWSIRLERIRTRTDEERYWHSQVLWSEKINKQANDNQRREISASMKRLRFAMKRMKKSWWIAQRHRFDSELRKDNEQYHHSARSFFTYHFYQWIQFYII